jgi:hypothetical protein
MHVAQLLWFLLILTKETNFASKLLNVLFSYKHASVGCAIAPSVNMIMQLLKHEHDPNDRAQL